MAGKLNILSTYVGYLGMIICLAAVVGRYYGKPYVLGFEASRLFLAGVGALVWACWLRLEVQSRQGAA